MGLLTVHDHPHILDETVNDLQSLSYDNPRLVLRESFESLQDRFNVLLSFLYKFDWVGLSKATPQRERTYWIVHV